MANKGLVGFPKSKSFSVANGGTSNSTNVNVSTTNTTGTRVLPAGYMGEFGTGKWRAFMYSTNLASGTSFVVPAGITSIRVRVVGAGAAGGNRVSSGQITDTVGGGGGGYAHGIFTVSPGTTYNVAVGVGGRADASGPVPGGASSFGSLISATGGNGYTGGVGIGGDFQSKGGNCLGVGHGGGGAGSQLGDGGNGYYGGGGILHAGGQGGGGSAFGPATTSLPGPNIIGEYLTQATETSDKVFNKNNPIDAVIRFPFDGFVSGGTPSSGTGAAGNSSVFRTGPGAGGGPSLSTYAAFNGGIGGGGGGTSTNQSSPPGHGGIGGGGGFNINNYAGGNGGDGLVVVEW